MTEHEFWPPWPTCDRSTGKCQLYEQISDMETDLANLRRGIDTLFNLLEGCATINNPIELELESAYFFAFTFRDHHDSLKTKWEALVAATDEKASAVDRRAEA